ncbi:MAG TPA: PspC domain-containing protein [Ornithinibacter sp.]|nr:PspC domain-containing protein [Ornithinibacter sp.]
MTENPTQIPPPPGSPPQASFLDDTFARLRASGYERDTDARWFGGVCAGLARRFGVDPVLIRAAAVVLAFVGGLGLTAYVVLWLVMPDRRGDILGERAVRRGDAGPIALLVLAVILLVGGVFSVGQGDGWITPFWLIPVAIVAWFVISRDRRRGTQPTPPPYGSTPAPYGPTPPPPPPGGPAMSTPTSMSAGTATGAATPAPPTAPYAGGQPGPYAPSQPYGSQPYGSQPHGAAQPGPYGGTAPWSGRPTPPAPPRPIAPPPPPQPRRRRPSAFVGLLSLGIVLVGMGLGAGLDDPLGFPGSSATLGFLIALTGVSLVVLALGLRGRASGFSGFLVVLLGLLLLASSAASRVEVQDGVGERTWTPVPATGVSSFELGAGDATLDLARLDTGVARSTPQEIRVDMGAGELTILVPEGLDARVDASVGIGSIRHTGSGVVGVNESSGTDRSTSTVLGDEPVQVVVDADLGLGQITIQEQ